MNFRHEWKHEINFSDLMVLRHRLQAVAQIDGHTNNGKYLVRSLYFDDPEDHALRAKLDGLDRREKFRLRFYNGDPGWLHLEKRASITACAPNRARRYARKKPRPLQTAPWSGCRTAGRLHPIHHGEAVCGQFRFD